mmetsp:Transcript_7823/g.11689  ORF Transcript_7823/g.11689 Transcript_7823/m.11689 type:complete len:397 (+) Transcript_7823:1-1191(+)
MEAAIPVEYVEYDPTVEETGDISLMSADQYLSWVRKQAENLPAVVRADIDCNQYLGRQTFYMPSIEEISPCPEEYLPDESWIRSTVHAFSELRLSLQGASTLESSKERKIAVPQLKDKVSWFKFCFGADKIQNGSEVEESSAEKRKIEEHIEIQKRELAKQFEIPMNSNYECEDDEDIESIDNGEVAVDQWTGDVKVSPSTSLMLQFDQVLTQRLLGYHIDWLPGVHQSSEENSMITQLQSQWLYSLLTRLEKPLHSDMTARIRSLYRICCRRRFNLTSVMKANRSNERHEEEEELARLNVLISLCGYYFGQGENLLHIPLNESEESKEDEDEEDDEMMCSDDDDEGAIEVEIEEYAEDDEDKGLKRKRKAATSNANKVAAVEDLEDGECDESMIS